MVSSQGHQRVSNAAVRVRYLREISTPQLVGYIELQQLQGRLVKELQTASFLLVPREGSLHPDDTQGVAIATVDPKQVAKPLLGL